MSEEKTLQYMPLMRNVGPSRSGWKEDQRIDADIRTQWINDGFTVLKGVYDQQDIDEYNRVVASERAVIADGKDQFGYGDRIGQLHQKHPSLLKLAGDQRIIDLLSWALDDEPVVFGSLNFERGTEQEAHIDAIFFWPEPVYSMAGVWIALEDVDPTAGPLFYIPGSHQWPFFHSEDVVRTRPELAARRLRARSDATEVDSVVGDLGNAWTEDLKNLQQKYDSPRITLPIKAGDVVVWHSLLAHGGSARQDLTRSRRSAVFHYIGAHTSLYTTQQFFLRNRDELSREPAQPMNLKRYNSTRYMSYPYFVSYSDGQQVVHQL